MGYRETREISFSFCLAVYNLLFRTSTYVMEGASDWQCLVIIHVGALNIVCAVLVLNVINIGRLVTERSTAGNDGQSKLIIVFPL